MFKYNIWILDEFELGGYTLNFLCCLVLVRVGPDSEYMYTIRYFQN